MNDERIAQMADNVATDIVGDQFPQATIPHVRTAAKEPDEDTALANVDQALDAMLAATSVLDDNLKKIKTANVPEKAAVDAVVDLVETAIKPYLADILKAMQIFGK